MNILFTILSNIIWMIVDTVIPGYVFLLFLQKYDGGGGERERKRRREKAEERELVCSWVAGERVCEKDKISTPVPRSRKTKKSTSIM